MNIFEYLQHLDQSGESSLSEHIDNELLCLAKKRCWEGYEAVPGKKPYSPGSCRKKSKKKSKKVDAFVLEVARRVAGDKKLFEFGDGMEAEMTLEDALNNYDSETYKVDAKGGWNEEEWMTIPEFIEHLEESDLSAPASVDGNHIAFELPDVGFQVINMVHKTHWQK